MGGGGEATIGRPDGAEGAANCCNTVLSVRCSKSANCCRALKTLSPRCNDGKVVFGGFFKRWMMSVAACWRNVSIIVCGKGMECGKNVIVSTSLSARDMGK